MSDAVVPVILSGGSGVRLWPRSRESRPKQFLSLLSEQTLLQETLLRVEGLGLRVLPPIIVCNEAHAELAIDQARAIGVEFAAVVIEPGARNTAPALAAAALIARNRAQEAGLPEPLLLVLPADHAITDVAAFAAAVAAASEAAAAGFLVTFGITPRWAETGYGYISRGTDRGTWSEVLAFIEKPDAPTAQRFLESGRHLWNSGMFLFSAEAFLRELAAHENALYETCERAVATAARDGVRVRLADAFLECAARSIDHAVMEKAQRVAVVPLDAGWSDVGSWLALHDALEKDDRGNVTVGHVVTKDCKNTYVASHGRLVVAVGLEGVIVVETGDAVLVIARDRAQDVKQIVEHLRATGRSEIVRD